MMKYPERTPRYTSYPPVPQWNLTIPKVDSYTGDIDLYIHIPYCQQLCYYCGCHRVISKDHGRAERLVKAILNEWKLITSRLGEVSISSLHFGGGTPTFLSPAEFQEIFEVLSPSFTKDFIGAVEVDPRTTDRAHFDVFHKYGVKRISMGIQDFNPAVQEIINRKQSYELVEEVVAHCREAGIRHINFDLIYGLPKQTIEGMKETLIQVDKLAPDMIACYGYAHLPNINSNQKLISNDDLPSSEMRVELNKLISQHFLDAGYLEIGMDHYAKDTSYLYHAVADKKLHRNFMGYTDKKSPVSIGLGPSAISDYPNGFAQNVKDLEEYFKFVESDELPLVKGHLYNREDKERGNVIQNIMCNGILDASYIDYVDSDVKKRIIEDLVADELLVKDGSQYNLGNKDYSRILASCFDEYFCPTNNQSFSRSV